MCACLFSGQCHLVSSHLQPRWHLISSHLTLLLASLRAFVCLLQLKWIPVWVRRSKRIALVQVYARPSLSFSFVVSFYAAHDLCHFCIYALHSYCFFRHSAFYVIHSRWHNLKCNQMRRARKVFPCFSCFLISAESRRCLPIRAETAWRYSPIAWN